MASLMSGRLIQLYRQDLLPMRVSMRSLILSRVRLPAHLTSGAIPARSWPRTPITIMLRWLRAARCRLRLQREPICISLRLRQNLTPVRPSPRSRMTLMARRGRKASAMTSARTKYSWQLRHRRQLPHLHQHRRRRRPRASAPSSTKSALVAPREIASRPKAPVPANRSSTRAPVTGSP